MSVILFYFLIILKAANGLKYYDVVEGKGPVAEKGSTVQVFFFFFPPNFIVKYVIRQMV